MHIREQYFSKIKPFINKQLIKVLTGQRRVGKSYMLKQIRDYILENNKNANCIFIDKELFEFDDITDYKTLMKYVTLKQKKTNNYLFIDEVQEIDQFEKTLRSLLNKGDFDIYCTGSNAKMLSSEISTILSGRQIVIRIHTLSYLEFLQFHKLKSNNNNLLQYLNFGGLPYLINLPNNKIVISEYLKNIYTTILFRDVVLRNNLRDVKFLDNLVKFLADSTGSLFSTKSIYNYLKSNKIDKSIPIINRYLGYLEDAYFITSIKRSDLKGKKIFDSGEKFYFEDLGIRNALAGFNPNDIHKNMENVVLNHLLINDYKVTVGNHNNKEIDFIATKNNEKVYIQVTYLLTEKSTIEREFGNLLAIKDNYPKYVITLDNFETPNTYEGIKHLILENFLVNFE